MMLEVVDAVVNKLNSNSSLKAIISNYFAYNDNIDLVEKGKAPFINVEGFLEKTESVSNMTYDFGSRRIFDISIHFCQKSKDKETAFRGDKKIAGLWTIKELIWDVLIADLTLGNVVTGIDRAPTIESGFHNLSHGLYLAIGRMDLSFYKDMC